MDKVARCQFCGKEFKEDDYDNYIKQCQLHEVKQHGNIQERFEDDLKKALTILDAKYKTKSCYENYNIDIITLGNDYDGVDHIVYNFTLVINNDIYTDIVLWGNNNEFICCPTIQDIIAYIEKYFTSNISKVYEGRVVFKEYFDKDNKNYMLNGQLIDDICHELLDKKIKITVVDD